MADPHIGLLSYQQAHLNGKIAPVPCQIYEHLTMLLDDAEGEQRLTYALTENDTVKAIVVYVHSGYHNRIPCFQVGYAVAEPFRNQGIAKDVLEKSIEEMRWDLGRHGPFYIEAVVGVSNVASQKVAAMVISATHESIIDHTAGQPALSYMHLIESQSDATGPQPGEKSR
ncbi:N-acetyltransferase [Crenobacter cavernae]|uniref:N-acetyltransferase n=2 Tax=Crenobacter cavernae TaxID=2290923 RepID=A0A345Y3M1_9NEIS|nr:N-acetyltransferase [Crenobacter cavernae]